MGRVKGARERGERREQLGFGPREGGGGEPDEGGVDWGSCAAVGGRGGG